jgi:uncharacterized membrane protein
LTETEAARPTLPIHVEETIEAIERLHAEHRADATAHQRVVDGITSFLDRPRFLAVLTIVILGWLGLNSLAASLSFRPLDPPPFPWLSGAASIVSLYLVVLILTTQKRDDRLTQRRELLSLELAILSEQKTAKVIALLEELRRDSPLIHNRIDEQADRMARPADPQTVIDATKGAHRESPPGSRPLEGV